MFFRGWKVDRYVPVAIAFAPGDRFRSAAPRRSDIPAAQTQVSAKRVDNFSAKNCADYARVLQESAIVPRIPPHVREGVRGSDSG